MTFTVWGLRRRIRSPYLVQPDSSFCQRIIVGNDSCVLLACIRGACGHVYRIIYVRIHHMCFWTHILMCRC